MLTVLEAVPLVTAGTFTPVTEQIGAIIPIVLVAGMAVYALIRGAKFVPKAIGWFIK